MYDGDDHGTEGLAARGGGGGLDGQSEPVSDAPPADGGDRDVSKSKPQETTAATDTSTHIPDWLEGAGQGAVFRAEDLSNRPYTPYTGEMVAPQSADTLHSYDAVRAMQGQGAPAFASSINAYGNLVGQAAPIT